MAASLDLARDAVKRGITHVVCTPHIHSGYFDNDLERISQVHSEFKKALHEHGIPLKSHYAAEYRISAEVMTLHAQNKLPFIGEWDGKPVLLLELPHSHIPAGADKLIAWLLRNNIQPMIAHPERNRDIIADFNKALWLKGKGVLFQLTAGALTGTFSTDAQNTACKILDNDLADIVASDAHSINRRPPEMDSAFAFIEKRYGHGLAEILCQSTPWEIAKKWFS